MRRANITAVPVPVQFIFIFLVLVGLLIEYCLIHNTVYYMSYFTAGFSAIETYKQINKEIYLEGH
jgi:hypothetical protein